MDQLGLIHGISLSLLSKYLPFCTDSLCSRNVAANRLVYDRYFDYLLKAHSLPFSEYKVRSFFVYPKSLCHKYLDIFTATLSCFYNTERPHRKYRHANARGCTFAGRSSKKDVGEIPGRQNCPVLWNRFFLAICTS